MTKYCVDCKYCDTVKGEYYTCSAVLDLVTKLPMDCRKLRETKCGAEGRLFMPKGSDAGGEYSETDDLLSDAVLDEYYAGTDEDWGDR